MTENSYEILGGDYERAGLASKRLKEQLKRIGVATDILRRVMIAAYEAEMNVVIHGGGGMMTTLLDEQHVRVEVADTEPGMSDIDLAMTEGYSTAPPEARELGFGAGMGLPNIRKNSDRFSVESSVGKGTRVCFTIRLRPQEATAQKPNSLHLAAEACTQCLRCLPVCPTRALRVRDGRPQKLDYLCVDCSRCVSACASGALTVQSSAGGLAPAKDHVLVVSPPFLAQFGPPFSRQEIVDALHEIGFGKVVISEGAEAALRAAVLSHAEGRGGPVISGACPAVLNLIEARFPSLIENVAPFLSPLEAVREELAGRRATFLVLCPAQETLVHLGQGPATVDTVRPDTLAAKVRPLLQKRSAPQAFPAGLPQDEDARIMRVSGLAHVVRVLEAIEDGLMADPVVLELYACDEGCFGSPLLHEDAFVARRRHRYVRQTPAATKAIPRTVPLAGRPGLRLDDNMAKAIEKLGQIDRLLQSLPGKNCGLCGSPTCATLAEDVLLGRAALKACRHVTENSR